ncbi:MAG: hypothetical protein WBV82_02195 [Myxococcaceae bacterium]
MNLNLSKAVKLAKSAEKFFKAGGGPDKIRKGLKKEQEVSHRLHADCQAAIMRMKAKDKGLAKLLETAYGYAVLPAVGKATLVLGAAYGMGEVFKGGKLIGYCGVGQFTLGVQLGGQTYSELVVFQNEEAFNRFKHAGIGFAANASAVLVKAGAVATNKYKNGLQIFVQSEGGMMIELGIGLQKLVFRPAALTRGLAADEELRVPKWVTETEGRRTKLPWQRPALE